MTIKDYNFVIVEFLKVFNDYISLCFILESADFKKGLFGNMVKYLCTLNLE